MKQERTISAYKNYFMDFISSLRKEEARKIYYILDMLKVQERVSSKFVKYLREELYEIRAEYGGNIFRVFFIFDDGNIVILFNGFQKKTQKTPGTPEREEFRKEAYAYCMGQIICDARKKEKMTQSELAEKIGTNKSYISRIEKGIVDPGISTFCRIIDALGLKIEIVKPVL